MSDEPCQFSRSRTFTPASTATRSSRGSRSRSTPARCTRSWGPTAPASPRWRRCSPGARTTRSPRARCSTRARTCSSWRPRSAPAQGSSSPSSTRSRSPASPTPTSSRRRSTPIRKARGQQELDAVEFLKLVREKVKLVELDESLMNRPVNEGFSGGEKKRNEIFHMAVLEPTPRGARRDRLRARHRRAQDRRRRRQPAARAGPRVPGDHPLPAPAQLHRARPRARAGRRPDRALRRQGARARARREGLRGGGDGGAGRRRGSARGCDGDDGRDRAPVLARAPPGRRAGGAASEPDGGGRAARARAPDGSREIGFPTITDEDWRFTNVAPLVRARLRAAPEPGHGDRGRGRGRRPIPGCDRLVFVDGQLAAGAHLDPVAAGGGGRGQPAPGARRGLRARSAASSRPPRRLRPSRRSPRSTPRSSTTAR